MLLLCFILANLSDTRTDLKQPREEKKSKVEARVSNDGKIDKMSNFRPRTYFVPDYAVVLQIDSYKKWY